MKKASFDDLLKSVKQAAEIARGDRASAREFHANAVMVKELCSREARRKVVSRR
jgi:hypothetical protein